MTTEKTVNFFKYSYSRPIGSMFMAGDNVYRILSTSLEPIDGEWERVITAKKFSDDGAISDVKVSSQSFRGIEQVFVLR